MQKKDKRILILSFTDHCRDPRVYRQILALNPYYHLITAGTCPETNQKTRHIELIFHRDNLIAKTKIAILLKARCFETQYWGQHIVKQAYEKLKPYNFDIIVTNDLETLPLALRLAKEQSAKVCFDAHEYSPKEFDGEFIFNFFWADYHDYLCRTYLPYVDAMTTVSHGIADEYKKTYGVSCDVLTNAPEYADLSPQMVKEERFRIIHHGGINKARKIENMIRLAGEYLDDRFELDLMLVNNNASVMKYLMHLANKYSNVNIVNPVSMPEIAHKINCYDIGIFMLPANCFNYKYALPNKLFEFIQGRLAIAIWPSPEMKRLVEQHQLGIVADDFTIEAMVDKLTKLTAEELTKYKTNSHQAAFLFNAENNAVQLQSIIGQLC